MGYRGIYSQEILLHIDFLEFRRVPTDHMTQRLADAKDADLNSKYHTIKTHFGSNLHHGRQYALHVAWRRKASDLAQDFRVW